MVRNLRFWSGTALILLLAAPSAFAACGERGGPGYRAPDGHCVGWADLERACGNPATMNCTPEMVANVPKAAPPGAQLLSPSIPHPARVLPRQNLESGPDHYAAPIPLFAAPQPLASERIGEPSIIDGDTLDIHGSRIRLSGIDAPESSQFCRGEDSLPFRCGAKAANDLSAFIARRPVTCVPVSLDQYGRTVATCSIGGIDLADWLVRNGLALDWPRYSSGKYGSAQRDAEGAGRGMWAGSFVEPWLYRVCIRAGGRPAACSDDASAHP
ncbi:endonuclease YncB(thermonuclease family) [Bradyrhizobium sp. RT3a]